MSEYNLSRKMTDKELESKAPQIYTLAKKLDPFLSRYGLDNHVASVGLLLDASGSMNYLYTSGKVQTIVERMLPFGIRFDDNATIDAWLFSNSVSQRCEITPDNFSGCVNKMGWHKYMGGTNYLRAIDTVINHYGTTTPRDYPVYLIFVTDGEPSGYKNDAINMIARLSELGVFTQFVALGEDWPVGDDLAPNQTQSKGGLLNRIKSVFSSNPTPQTEGMKFLVEMDEQLDTTVDSVNAFAVKYPATVSEERLYALMTREYPLWIPKAKSAGLIK